MLRRMFVGDKLKYCSTVGEVSARHGAVGEVRSRRLGVVRAFWRLSVGAGGTMVSNGDK